MYFAYGNEPNGYHGTGIRFKIILCICFLFLEDICGKASQLIIDLVQSEVDGRVFLPNGTSSSKSAIENYRSFMRWE